MAASRSGGSCEHCSSGVDVVVATPGRAVDHIRRGRSISQSLRVVVLDEADEMLDMGFAEDLEAILAATPAGRQTVLFSATLPPRIAAIARRHLQRPGPHPDRGATAWPAGSPGSARGLTSCPRAHKAGRSRPGARHRSAGRDDRVLPDPHRSRRRPDRDPQRARLPGRGAPRRLSQEQRDRVMGRLRGGTADLLVATDVAARGLDIDQSDPRRQLRRPVRSRTRTCTGSAGSGVPAGKAWPSRLPSRVSTGCSRPSSGPRSATSGSRRSRRPPTCTPEGWS